jgi:hypothetical protein
MNRKSSHLSIPSPESLSSLHCKACFLFPFCVLGSTTVANRQSQLPVLKSIQYRISSVLFSIVWEQSSADVLTEIEIERAFFRIRPSEVVTPQSTFVHSQLFQSFRISDYEEPAGKYRPKMPRLIASPCHGCLKTSNTSVLQH